MFEEKSFNFDALTDHLANFAKALVAFLDKVKAYLETLK